MSSLLDVQRLTAEERNENLESARYAGEARLKAAFDNSPPMHWLDFRRTWQLTVGRLLANVRRLTPERTHLTGSGPDECNRNVGAFLAVASGDPGLAIVADKVAPGYGALPPIVIPPVDAQSNLVRDSGPHRAESTPPRSQGPVRPNIDTAKNPFGCAAFFVGFGPGALPGVPGAPSTEVVKDLGDPPKQPWHLL